MRIPPRGALRTARLLLEPMTLALADPVWAAAETSLDELRPWMLWAAEGSLDETRRFGASAERAWAEGREFAFTIKAGDEVVGGAGLSIRDERSGWGEVGYWIRSDVTGRGYAAEATGALVSLGFDEVELHRLELRAGVENLRSRRVAEKLGFTLEGTMREAGAGADGRYDCCLYARLATDPAP